MLVVIMRVCSIGVRDLEVGRVENGQGVILIGRR